MLLYNNLEDGDGSGLSEALKRVEDLEHGEPILVGRDITQLVNVPGKES